MRRVARWLYEAALAAFTVAAIAYIVAAFSMA